MMTTCALMSWVKLGNEGMWECGAVTITYHSLGMRQMSMEVG